MIEYLTLDSIWTWGMLLIIIFPIAILVLNEAGYFLIQKERQLQRPIRTLKNYVLPLIAVALLLIQVLEFDRSTTAIKVLETIIWMLLINTGLAIVNKLFFSENTIIRRSAKIPQLFLDIFRIFMVLLGAAIVLSFVWGVELNNLITTLGLGSFVIGLALQDTLGNLFSGIALVYERPFKVGDWIKVEEDFGEVIEMNWRAVRIRTREGELVVIPHLMIGQGVIINYSKPNRIHVIKVNVKFSYKDPPNKIKKALMETCMHTPGIIPIPEPEVKTQEYGDSSIVYEVEFAIEDFAFHEEITDEFMTRVWYTAQRYRLTIPFPQMTLHNAETKPSVTDDVSDMLAASIAKLPQYLPITPTNAKELFDGSTVDFFGKGEFILRQSEKVSSLYVLLEGEVGLYVNGKEGKEILIAAIHEGDFFGEVAMLSSRRNSMSAYAETDIKVLTISPAEVMDMVARNPKLANLLDEVMDQRRHNIQNELKF